MSAIDERFLAEQRQQEYDIKKRLAESKNLKPMPLNVVPEKGYYITGADAAKYREEAREYNKKLSEYKQGLNEAYKNVISNKASLGEYDTASQTYIKKMVEQAPQRKEAIKYIKKQLTQGPAAPTQAQRARQEAGLPATGLPGPSQAAPGSMKAKATEFSRDVLLNTEKPFIAVTKPIQQSSRFLEQLSRDSLKTDQAYQQDKLFGSQTQPVISLSDEQIRVKGKQEPALGLAAYVGSVGLDVIKTGFDVATFEVRPGLMVESAQDVKRLVSDTDTQREFFKTVASDPFRFTSTVIGGALLGPQLKKMPGQIESSTRKWYSKREFERLGLDEELFTQFERELGMDFPQETVSSTSTQQLFKRKDLVTDKGKLPYYLETSPEVEKLLRDAENLMDTWKPDQMTKGTDSYYALPYDEKGGAILVKGKSGMKPISYPEVTEVVKPQSSKQVTVTVPKTPSVTKTTQKSGFFTQTMAQETVEYIPAFNLKSTLFNAPKVTLPNMFPDLASFSVSALTQAPKAKTKSITSQVQMPEIKLKSFTVPTMGDIVVPGVSQFTSSIPKQIQTPSSTQLQTPIPKQIQVPQSTQIQTPIVTQIQVPIPSQVQVPTPTIPQIPIPKYEATPRIYVPEPEKKKKKRKVSKRKNIYEFRVDPLKITFPKIKIKNVKVPKF